MRKFSGPLDKAWDLKAPKVLIFKKKEKINQLSWAWISQEFDDETNLAKRKRPVNLWQVPRTNNPKYINPAPAFPEIDKKWTIKKNEERIVNELSYFRRNVKQQHHIDVRCPVFYEINVN